jgi:hypothetical protein
MIRSSPPGTSPAAISRPRPRAFQAILFPRVEVPDEDGSVSKGVLDRLVSIMTAGMASAPGGDILAGREAAR